MCGLAGLLRATPDTEAVRLEALAGAMGDALEHRGPDDRGVWSTRKPASRWRIGA